MLGPDDGGLFDINIPCTSLTVRNGIMFYMRQSQWNGYDSSSIDLSELPSDDPVKETGLCYKGFILFS